MTQPLIGLEVDLEATPSGRRFAKCYEAYFDQVVDAGGAPVLLPPVAEPAYRRVLARVDGVVVPGGDDLHADEWGEEQRPCERFVPVDARRLAQGKLLLELVLARGLPFLGVCYGAQLLNVVRGGPLVQDIPDAAHERAPAPSPTPTATTAPSGAIDHASAAHALIVEPDTLLARLAGEAPPWVNSRHHQAIRAAGRGLRVAARAPDGVVEAIEGDDPERFLLGVQWHPEELGASPFGLGLFAALVEASRAALLRA